MGLAGQGMSCEEGSRAGGTDLWPRLEPSTWIWLIVSLGGAEVINNK